jgi:hypothetical protein
MFLSMLSSTGKYFIGTLGGASTDVATAVTNDASGNCFVCGWSQIGASAYLEIAKYNSSGNIQWQTKIGSVIGAYGTSIKVDSSGNIYVTGVSSSVGTNDFYIAKLNSLGVIQWQNRLGNAGADDQAFSVAIDSSLNVYVCGSVVIDTQPELLLVKYDSSGTLQWQTRLRSASLTVQGREVVIDASNYIYVAGFSDDPFRQVYVIAKYDSSGAIQWQQYYYDISTAMAYSLTLDSSGNIYVVGKYNYTYQYFQITKLDSSGVIQWQKKLGSSIGAGSSYSIAIDSLNNLYVVGTWTYNSSIQIIKYNSSGVIQWQRQLSSSGQEEGNSISVNDSDIFICGTTDVSGNINFLFAKLKTDGSLTGTYTVGAYNFTYSTSSLTDSNSTLTASTGSYTSQSGSFTNSSDSQVASSSSLTSSVTIIS